MVHSSHEIITLFFSLIVRLCLQMGPTDERTELDSDEEKPFSTSPSARKSHTFDFEAVDLGPRAGALNLWIQKQMRFRPLRSIYIVLLTAKINVLLPFGPLAILLHYLTGKHVSGAPERPYYYMIN